MAGSTRGVPPLAAFLIGSESKYPSFLKSGGINAVSGQSPVVSDMSSGLLCEVGGANVCLRLVTCSCFHLPLSAAAVKLGITAGKDP